MKISSKTVAVVMLLRVGIANDNSSILFLPCDLHGLVYSYLEWDEKMIFISLSKEISSLSRSYREMRLNYSFSHKYSFRKKFRDRVCAVVLPCHIDLNLSSWDGERDPITDECLHQLRDVRCLDLSCSRGFTYADLAFRQQITDIGLRHLGNLQSLDLSYCRGFTDAGLAYLRNLKKINLACCDQITDEGLRHLGNLQSLGLSFCPEFTDAGLAYLRNLKEIDLYGCDQITDEGLTHLRNVHIIVR
jgi:hypothetical protein